MKLNGAQYGQLLNALLSAFTSSSALSQMVSIHLNENLNAIASGGGLRDIAFNLIQWAESRDDVGRLIAAARAANPGNPDLRAIDFGSNTQTLGSVSPAAHYHQEEPVHDFRDRPIHPSHLRGMQLLVRDALSTTTSPRPASTS